MAETRDSFIQNAVSFLLDPSVQSSSIENRILFLEKKGLSAAEIDVALSKAGLERPGRNGTSNTSAIQQLSSQLSPNIPSNGPSTALQNLATSNGFSWQRLMLYVALLSGAAAAINMSKVSEWARIFIKRVRKYLVSLFYGNEIQQVHLSSSVSLDRLADVKQQIQDLQNDIGNLNAKVECTIEERLQQVKDTMKMTYSKLEDEIEELKSQIVQ